ncbi:hypothetical protein RF11_05331 [Thelohanellus kitauei]|uniref:Reverse transcriptase domain-containing protein n=1 Tax=Thelohanellus kitauei TaxID=669202 RepID=A0A0C2N0I0_THEKT|nr:hypothetical protein RF11_05331 [Thelohanellus kitauei]
MAKVSSTPFQTTSDPIIDIFGAELGHKKIVKFMARRHRHLDNESAIMANRCWNFSTHFKNFLRAAVSAIGGGDDTKPVRTHITGHRNTECDIPAIFINEATLQSCPEILVVAVFEELPVIFISMPYMRKFEGDDIIVTSSKDADHFTNFEEILKRLQACNVTTHRSKCKFLLGEENFLGHTIDCKGINPIESKIESITNLP